MIPFVQYAGHHTPPIEAAVLLRITLRPLEPNTSRPGVSVYCLRCWTSHPAQYIRDAKMAWLFEDGRERTISSLLCAACMDACSELMRRGPDYWRLVFELLTIQVQEGLWRDAAAMKELQVPKSQPLTWTPLATPSKPKTTVKAPSVSRGPMRLFDSEPAPLPSVKGPNA